MLKLVQVANGVLDLAFDDPSINDADAVVATIIYAALFTDAKAPEGRVSDPADQRGWWANPTAGTGLWYLRRQGLSDDARRESLQMVLDALTSRAPGLVDVQITENIRSAGNVSSVLLNISGMHNGRAFLVGIPL